MPTVWLVLNSLMALIKSFGKLKKEPNYSPSSLAWIVAAVRLPADPLSGQAVKLTKYPGQTSISGR